MKRMFCRVFFLVSGFSFASDVSAFAVSSPVVSGGRQSLRMRSMCATLNTICPEF